MMPDILTTINESHTLVKQAFDQYVPLLLEARKANDRLPAAVQLHEVLGQIEAVAKAGKAALKGAIVQQMTDDGEFQVEAGPYTASLRKGATRAVVTDEKALKAAAPELFKPQPDKVMAAELSRVLKFKPELPGAEFVEGDPTITVKGNTK